jgi:phosphoglycerate dehydrogenase-like enzyme
MNILVAMPETLRKRIQPTSVRERLEALGTVAWNESGRDWSGSELAARLPGVDALITGWGITRIDGQVLASADKLRFIGHTAGSVKSFISSEVFERGITVTHAASRIADSVAEFALTMALIGLKHPDLFNAQMHQGVSWEQNPHIALHEVAGTHVGILGCGYVGQRSARLFRALGAEVWVYDPYLRPSLAQELGVRMGELEEILTTCKVVSVHLPSTPETRQMLSADRLAMLPDGTIFINTARSWVIDEEALTRELTTGRIWAAIDVFEQEPLPPEHPLRRLPNAFITPHIAGRTIESYQNLVTTVVDELARFIDGKPLLYQVTRDMLPIMA